MSSVLKKIGVNIKIERTRRNLSQADLAYKLGVEQGYISKLERGVLAASCERLYEIIHVLKCDTSNIFPSAEQVQTQFSGKD